MALKYLGQILSPDGSGQADHSLRSRLNLVKLPL